MLYTEDINGIKYTFSAEEAMRPFAEPLLEALEYIPAGRIKDGFKIRAGFSTFMLSERGGGFDIAAPDYTDDPLTTLTTDLTLALHIQFRQAFLLHKHGIVGKAIHFSEKLAIAKGARDKELISMQRFADLGGSGWAVESYTMNEEGFAVPEKAEEYEMICAYELLGIRPALLDVLALPDNYVAVFSGDELIELMDGERKSLI